MASDPTVLFDDLELPKHRGLNRFGEDPFGVNVADTVEEYNRRLRLERSEKKKDPRVGCLYSYNGSIALMDAAINYSTKG